MRPMRQLTDPDTWGLSVMAILRPLTCAARLPLEFRCLYVYENNRCDRVSRLDVTSGSGPN
jgi:hypothetical protein